MESFRVSHDDENNRHSPSSPNVVLPSRYSVATPYTSITQTSMAPSHSVAISGIKNPISKRHLSFIRPLISFTVTCFLFFIMLIITGVPPLYASSPSKGLIYICVMIPTTAIAASVLHYFMIQQPLRRLSLFLVDISAEAEHHRSAVDALMQSDKGYESPAPTRMLPRSPVRARPRSRYGSAFGSGPQALNSSRHSEHDFNNTNINNNNSNNKNNSDNNTRTSFKVNNNSNISFARHSPHGSGIHLHDLESSPYQRQSVDNQRQLHQVIQWMSSQLQKIEKINRNPLHPEVRLQQRALYSFLQSMLSIQQSLTLLQSRQTVMRLHATQDDASPPHPPLLSFDPLCESSVHGYQGNSSVTVEGRESAMDSGVVQQPDTPVAVRGLRESSFFLCRSAHPLREASAAAAEYERRATSALVLGEAAATKTTIAAASASASASASAAKTSAAASAHSLYDTQATLAMRNESPPPRERSECVNATAAPSSAPSPPLLSDKTNAPPERMQIYSAETAPLSDSLAYTAGSHTQTYGLSDPRGATWSMRREKAVGVEDERGSLKSRHEVAGTGIHGEAAAQQAWTTDTHGHQSPVPKNPMPSAKDARLRESNIHNQNDNNNNNNSNDMNSINNSRSNSTSSRSDIIHARVNEKSNKNNISNPDIRDTNSKAHESRSNLAEAARQNGVRDKDTEQAANDVRARIAKPSTGAKKNEMSLIDSSIASRESMPASVLAKRSSRSVIQLSLLDVPTPVLDRVPAAVSDRVSGAHKHHRNNNNSNNNNSNSRGGSSSSSSSRDGLVQSRHDAMRQLTLGHSPMPRRVPTAAQTDPRWAAAGPPLSATSFASSSATAARMITLCPSNRLMPRRRSSLSGVPSSRAALESILNLSIFFYVDVVRLSVTNNNNNTDSDRMEPSSRSSAQDTSSSLSSSLLRTSTSITQRYAFEANVSPPPPSSSSSLSVGSHPVFGIHDGLPYRVFRVDGDDAAASSAIGHRALVRRRLSVGEMRQLDFLRCVVERAHNNNNNDDDDDDDDDEQAEEQDRSSVDTRHDDSASAKPSSTHNGTLKKAAQHMDPHTDSVHLGNVEDSGRLDNNTMVRTGDAGNGITAPAAASFSASAAAVHSMNTVSPQLPHSDDMDDTVYSEPDVSYIPQHMHNSRNARGADAPVRLPPAASYVLAWSVMPSRPMRLTFLQTKVVTELTKDETKEEEESAAGAAQTPGHAHSSQSTALQAASRRGGNGSLHSGSVSHTTAVLPVLECLVNNVYSVLTNARVTLTRAAGSETDTEVVQSVELFATSIEEEEDDDVEEEEESRREGRATTQTDDYSRSRAGQQQVPWTRQENKRELNKERASAEEGHAHRSTAVRPITFGSQVTECRTRRR